MPETASLGSAPEQKQTTPATAHIPIVVLELPPTEIDNSDQDSTKSAIHITVETIETIDMAASETSTDITFVERDVNADSKSEEYNPEKEFEYLEPDLCDWQPDDSKPVPSWRPWPFHGAFFAFLMIMHGLQIFIIIIIWRQHYNAERTPGDVNFTEKLTMSDIRLGKLHEKYIQIRHNPPAQFKFEDRSGPFFVWQYLPVLSALCIGLLWTTVDVAARRLEPFYQMSLPNGARAEDSISRDYMSAWVFFLPLKATNRGHWSVAISSLIVICTTTVLPALQGAMWKISWDCPQERYYHTCSAVVREMNVAVIFSTIAVHVVVLSLAGHLASIVCFRNSGLVNDPGGVTALASLICDSPRMQDLLRTIPSYSSQNNINFYLQPYRFKLQYLFCKSTRCGDHIKEAYQIVPILDEEFDPTQRSEATRLEEFKFDRHEAHPISLRGVSILAVECILTIPNIIIFFASRTDAPNWSILAIKGALTFGWTVMNSFWELVERDLRIMQPYYQATRQVKPIGPQGWMGEFLSPPPLVSFFAFISHDATLLALVSFRNCANQIFTIANPTLLFVMWNLIQESGSEGPTPNVISNAVRIFPWFVFPVSFIGLIIFFVLLCRRRTPILPRKPDTISSNLVYICKSHDLLKDLRGMSLLKTEEIKVKCRERCNQAKQEYDFFGWFKVSDSRLRLGFARQSKIVGPFVYGEPFSRS